MEELSALMHQASYRQDAAEIDGEDALQHVLQMLAVVTKNRGLVYVIGNGGSAGIASHFCTDLIKTLNVPASTLTDPGVMTCIGNDLGYEYVYSAPLQRNFRETDLLVAISSSGKSPNILNAVAVAKEKRGKIMTLSGFKDDNPLRASGHLNFWVPSSDYGLVEMAHFFMLHTVVDALSLTYAK
jgi:D-sedoheptulose 7-phosphate isomerase